METTIKNQLKSAIAGMMDNQDFVAEMGKAAGPEEIRALLAEHGIEATVEQIEEIMEDGFVIGEKVISDDGEIDIEALEKVSGGGPVGGLILGGMFLVGGIVTRAGWKRTVIAAGTAFAIGCMAPCP